MRLCERRRDRQSLVSWVFWVTWVHPKSDAKLKGKLGVDAAR